MKKLNSREVCHFFRVWLVVPISNERFAFERVDKAAIFSNNGRIQILSLVDLGQKGV